MNLKHACTKINLLCILNENLIGNLYLLNMKTLSHTREYLFNDTVGFGLQGF